MRLASARRLLSPRASGPCSGGIRRYSPQVARSQPAFAAQGFDDMVGSLGAAAEQIDDLRPRRLPPPPFGERQHDLAFLRR